jgi:hypothetical protein
VEPPARARLGRALTERGIEPSAAATLLASGLDA